MIISPIGGQGFLLGRGNKQISGRVFDLIGFDNIIIVSTEEKLNDIKDLYIDINTSKKLPEYVRILTGYGYFKIKRLVH
ncbi:NAD(+)/NADH kinase [Acidiplasma cupricumulans]|nr:NAD(+)/NADH kinase [Acidiplasma cupricumulans]